jgi:ABC-type sulfate transport system substrate-binding protein
MLIAQAYTFHIFFKQRKHAKTKRLYKPANPEVLAKAIAYVEFCKQFSAVEIAS